MKTWIGVVGCVVLAGLTGCERPKPPITINAQTPDDRVLYNGPPLDSPVSVELLASCERMQEYATIITGDWVRHWYIVGCRVIDVTQGRWSGREVRFVCVDPWPTVESGIVLKKAAFPYAVGRLYHLRLDDRATPAMIVSMEIRSRVAPYGPVTAPSWDLDDPESRDVYEKVQEAARTLLTQGAGGESVAVGPGTIIEEHAEFYVVEFNGAEASPAVVVDKDGYTARVVSAPFADRR